MTREDRIKRLEAGEMGRESDRDIGLAIGGWQWVPEDDEICQRFPDRKWLNAESTIFADHDGALAPVSYTESVDDAVALCERVRPDARIQIQSYTGSRGRWFASIALPEWDGGPGATAAGMKSPAAALLAALLKSTEPHQ